MPCRWHAGIDPLMGRWKGHSARSPQMSVLVHAHTPNTSTAHDTQSTHRHASTSDRSEWFSAGRGLRRRYAVAPVRCGGKEETHACWKGARSRRQPGPGSTRSASNLDRAIGRQLRRRSTYCSAIWSKIRFIPAGCTPRSTILSSTALENIDASILLPIRVWANLRRIGRPGNCCSQAWSSRAALRAAR